MQCDKKSTLVFLSCALALQNFLTVLAKSAAAAQFNSADSAHFVLVQASDDDVPAPAKTQAKPKPKPKPVTRQKPATKKTIVKAAKPLPASRAIADGIYFRLLTSFFNGRLSLTQEHYVFWNNGHVYRGVPAGGLEAFAYAAARKKEPANIGTYEIKGKQIIFHWANGQQEKMTFARKGDGLELDGIFTSRQKRFKKGQRLNNTYNGGASASGGGSYVGSAQTLRLKANGTFEWSRIGSISNDATSASSESTKKGTYYLNGYTMILKYQDGTTSRHTAYPFDLGEGRTAFNLDGAMLHPPK